MIGLVAITLLAFAPERILAVDNYVVASTFGGRWRAADERFAKGRRPASFRPFGLGTAGGAARTSGFEWSEEQHGVYVKRQDVRPLLAGGVPRAPRRVREGQPTAEYEAACRRFLALKGLPVTKARVTRVLRVDLDGDGTDEAMIEATNGEPSYQSPKGTYSLVLLRALRGGKVVETALELAPSAPGGTLAVAQVRAVADLDGDGRMEVLTTTRGLEDFGARLWGYRAGRATMLVENGNGV